MKKTVLNIAMAAAFALPAVGQATIFQFNASLARSNEILPDGSHASGGSTATGVATLFYNDLGTASVADDTYDFAMSAFGLTGDATAFHIHGSATTEENAPVRINLDQAPFVFLNSGGTLLVGGNDVPVPASIPATSSPPGPPPNAGHPEMSFLAMLRSGLGYVNVHTAMFGSGEIRGQLIEVTAVPEPETYALMLAGLGIVGWVASRRRKIGV